MSKDITGTVPDRLRALTTTYNDATETWQKHRDRWQRAIVDALDDGYYSTADIAALVGVSPQRINAIVARVYSQANA